MSPILRYFSCIVFGLMLGVSATLAGKENATTSSDQYSFPMLLDIIETIETYYVEEVTRQQLVDAAIQGIFNQLDPYSDLLEQQELTALKESNQGEYFGYGFEVATDQNQIKIVTPFPNSPAERAGIQAGDVVVSLNNQTLPEEDLSQLLDEVRESSRNHLDLLLELKSAQTDEIYEVNLTPEAIKVFSVTSEILEGDIGYIRLANFQKSSADEIEQVLMQWQGTPLQGIILDLRNNPGGLLDQAIKIADLFLEEGRITSTQGRFFDANTHYFASNHSVNQDNLLVLINQGSASAAEVLAAALQDNQRATLMGEQSFGKGTIQSLIPTLYSDHAIKLTIAHYNTPNGINIHQQGITPDVTFSNENNPSLAMQVTGTSRDNELKSAIHWMNQQ